MKLVLAIVLNAALLALLLPWLRRQWQWAGLGWWRVALGLGLGLRVAVGLVRNWTLQLDAEYMHRMGQYLTLKLWTDPTAFWRMFTGTVTVFQFAKYQAVYQSSSNTWFLIKALSLLNLASLSTGWLNGLYLSIFSFVGCWQLVRVLAEVFPRTPAGAGVVAFILWPTVWFWATGISKEAVLLGSGAWLMARVVQALYGEAAAASSVRQRARWWVGPVGLGILHFFMRYFFAVPLLGVLAGIALGHGLQQLGLVRQRWAQAVVLAAVLGTGAWLAPQLSIAFRINKFTNQVVRVYGDELAHTAGQPHFEYPDLRPTLESLTAHVPQAIVNALSRPWLNEAKRPMYLAASLESLALVTLLVIAVVAAVRGRGGHLPFALGLGLGVFCLLLAILIGLTTPNFGLLSRYRTELVPFFLLLVLQNDYAAARLRWLRPSYGAK